jgi:hypothetical protein
LKGTPLQKVPWFGTATGRLIIAFAPLAVDGYEMLAITVTVLFVVLYVQ